VGEGKRKKARQKLSVKAGPLDCDGTTDRNGYERRKHVGC
jgi:hypothetical protein